MAGDYRSHPHRSNWLSGTILHAVGKPRDTFNRSPVAKDPPAAFGPLKELLA